MSAPLPQITLDYLQNGASEGERNNALLAAACQFRDAGYIQAEAERQLVDRAVRTGLTAAEAERTIASAYSQAKRDPLPARHDDSGQRQPMRKLTEEERNRIREQDKENRLAARAHCAVDTILREHSCGYAHFIERSPAYLLDRDPAQDGVVFLSLFDLSDVVWIGHRWHSESGDCSERIEECASHFRTVAEWLRNPPSPEWQLTCPSTFKPGSYSRSNANVAERKFLVVESDKLDKNQVCAVFKWLQQFMRQRAIVDTAGKSLHGWFDTPQPECLGQLRVILPAFGCDPAMFTESQPCRMPGALRDGKQQSLLYLDLKGGAVEQV